MDGLRRSSRISRKDRIRSVTIRQQIGLEETIIKEIGQNKLTWCGHVQRMAEERPSCDHCIEIVGALGEERTNG